MNSSVRKQVSKRLRFEVFKRDGFECQYCGAHPPKAILHVDHIVPVAEGGGNEIDNLVYSCADCNLGKSAISLSSVPQSLKEKAEEIKEREDQLRGYHEIIESKRNRIEQEAWRVAEVFSLGCSDVGGDGFYRSCLLSIKKFIEQIGVHECIEAAEFAVAKGFCSEDREFRYFCGICWAKIKEGSNGSF